MILQNKDYEKAKTIPYSTYCQLAAPTGFYGTRYDVISICKQEQTIRNYAEIMSKSSSSSIDTYTSLYFSVPLDGVLTKEQLDELRSFWKEKAEKDGYDTNLEEK
ncbi:hypothetical protein [Paenibacillus sp. SN-8-1]|uniref:hypothetical protein n=1 Tax=Paenibacillus sp. SN-8-1 TaxID=3435409 RepID=UPI003D9A6D8D